MDDFSLQELAKELDTHMLGRHAVLLDSVDSTNAEARRLLGAGCADGAAIIAREQTAGRGRRGRGWVSEDGCGLWLTVVIRPFMPVDEMQKLTLLAGLAVCRAVARCTDGALKPAIKWPNDVLACGRKLCGILSESAVDAAGARHAIVGIGVNTRRPESGYGDAEGRAISVEEACGRVPPRLRLAAVLLTEMERLLELWRAAGFAPLTAEYREHMLPAGSHIAIMDGNGGRRGRIEGLDDGGGLLVRLEDGRLERIISGEISLREDGGHV